MEDAVSSFMEDTFLRKPPVRKGDFSSRSMYGTVECGSNTEFYIVTLLRCVGDYDALLCMSFMLAFSGCDISFPGDVQFFEENISCFRILPYEKYPSFVQLHFAGDMKYNWDFKKYEFFQATESKFVSGDFFRELITKRIDQYDGRIEAKVRGPALKESITSGDYDYVYCIRCPKWPQEAKEWPTRNRNAEWPLYTLIHEVVGKGCHVVCAQHRDCREDEFQFRLSFSFAEVILLRSWTPTQQLIYHMLRFFAKKELIEADCPKEKEVLCTYHLKTLMLWTCEKESAEWWNSSSVVAICCKLLRKLLQWIEKRHCPNYFIPDANIFSGKIDPMVANSIAVKLEFFHKRANLSQWFASNYLLVKFNNVTEGRAPHEVGEFRISRLKRAILRKKTQEQLMIFDDRFNKVCFEYINGFWRSCEIVNRNEIKIYAHINKDESNSSKNLFSRFEIPFIYLHSALVMLFAANALTCKRVLKCDDFVSDVLSAVSLGTATASPDWRKYHRFPRTYRERLQKSHSYLLIAQEHMGKLQRPYSGPEFQLMSRLAMQYFRKAYNSRDLATCSVRRATAAYMSAICFATSQPQAAIDLCWAILQNGQPLSLAASQMPQSNEVPLDVCNLLFIDDVSNSVGFILLVITIRPAYKRRPENSLITLDMRITLQVFAVYIMTQSAEMMSRKWLVNWCEIPAVSLIDSILMKCVKRKLSNIAIFKSRLCVYRRHVQVEEVLDRVAGFSLNEDISIRLLMECSLESIVLFYKQISDHYGVQCHTVVSCYRALYCFKRRQYDNVLSLCDEIFADPELEDYLKKLSAPQILFPNNYLACLAFPNVLALRPFNAYFDDDLHCLIALQALCHVSFSERAAPTIRKKTFDARLREQAQPHNEVAFNLLLEHQSFVFQYFLGRHFLARYLKFRCFLLCDDRSISEIFKEFDELKPQLPFEYVICQFLLQKLNRDFLV